MSLLCILFEDLVCVLELHEEFADDVTEQHSLDPSKYVFNGQEEGDECNYFLFGQGMINDFNSADSMNHGVCLHTKSFTKICLHFRMNSV